MVFSSRMCFAVLASLLLAASVTAIPTEAEKNAMKKNPACVADIVGSGDPPPLPPHQSTALDSPRPAAFCC